MTDADIIQPPSLPDTTERHYSQARLEGNRLYVSGMVGRDSDFDPVGDDITAQTKQAFSNVEVILRSADGKLSDISTVTSYIVNGQENYPAYQRVWEDTFETPPYPCHTAVGVDELVIDEFLIEIEVEARL